VRRAVCAEGCLTSPLVLHADNGSPMKGATLKVTLDHLGVTASYSRPRVSNDNPFSEALFRTCKYRPEWPSKGFSGIEAARDWVKRFATWYNRDHLHSGIRFVAPNTRHAGQDQTVLAQRACLWAKARAARPERWSGQPRNWAPVADVWLNPERATGALKIRDAA
jgi:putative transposase